MEYVIKDSFQLQTYRSRIPGLIDSKNTPELARAYKRIADYYYLAWRIDSLLWYYKSALEQYQIAKDSFNIFYCRYRIGETITHDGKNPDESLGWHLPGTRYFEKAKEYNMAAYANYEVSKMYKEKNETILWQKHLEKAIELNKIAKDTLLDIVILSFQCNEWKDHGNWNEMIAGGNRMIELSRKIKEPVFIKVGLVFVGSGLLELNKPADALPYLEESVKLSDVTRDAIPETYRLLAICYLRLNKNDEAEKFLALYKHSADSIANQNTSDNYERLLVQFETEKKEATIAALQNENILKGKLSRNQKLFIILLAATLGLVLIAVWAFSRNHRKRRKLESELLQQQAKHAEQLQHEKEEKMTSDFNKQLAEVQLTALSAQMNPHFIFNCMNSIQKYVLKNECFDDPWRQAGDRLYSHLHGLHVDHASHDFRRESRTHQLQGLQQQPHLLHIRGPAAGNRAHRGLVGNGHLRIARDHLGHPHHHDRLALDLANQEANRRALEDNDLQLQRRVRRFVRSGGCEHATALLQGGASHD